MFLRGIDSQRRHTYHDNDINSWMGLSNDTATYPEQGNRMFRW
jgi:hypothetical protein